MRKYILRVCVCIVIVAAFLGCAAPSSDLGTSPSGAESLRPGYDVVYYPNLQPDISLISVQERMNRTGGRNSRGVFVSDDTAQYGSWHLVKSMSIDNNRIEIKAGSDVRDNDFFANSYITISPTGFQPKSIITVKLFNYNLLNQTIVVERSRDKGYYPYVIFIEDVMAFRFYQSDLAGAKTIANALYFLQQKQKANPETLDKELERFESIAAQYRALTIKPPVSEEQRRYIVQANALAEQKQYEKAQEKYLEVIKLDPTSYPAAYFNMALLDIQEHDPRTAIFRMKQYLLLVPDAQDARSAQDKIYEWELMMHK